MGSRMRLLNKSRLVRIDELLRVWIGFELMGRILKLSAVGGSIQTHDAFAQSSGHRRIYHRERKRKRERNTHIHTQHIDNECMDT